MELHDLIWKDRFNIKLVSRRNKKKVSILGIFYQWRTNVPLIDGSALCFGWRLQRHLHDAILAQGE